MAVDSVGAGVGEEVFFVRGKEASFPFYPVRAPSTPASSASWTMDVEMRSDGFRLPIADGSRHLADLD